MDRKASKGYLIALSGVDCSGKSTQLTLLKQYLQGAGYAVSVCWYRPGYSRRLDALRRFLRRLSPRTLPPPGANPQRDALFDKRRVQIAWSTMAIVDTLMELGLALRRRLAKYDIVLYDRYILDALLDLRFKSEHVERHERVVETLLRVACPAPDIHLLLDLPLDDVIGRSNNKLEPFPDAEHIRQLRYNAYKDLSRRHLCTIIDAGGDQQTVHRVIRTHVDRALSTRSNSIRTH